MRMGVSTLHESNIDQRIFLQIRMLACSVDLAKTVRVVHIAGVGGLAPFLEINFWFIGLGPFVCRLNSSSEGICPGPYS